MAGRQGLALGLNARAPRIAIVGGGWAGLAAAMELVDSGLAVTVHEAAREPGGRARGVVWNGLRIDNGQHLMIGAYTRVLELLRRLGSVQRLERRRLDLRAPAFRLHLPRLPAPLHLAAGLALSRGLGWSERIAAVRLMHALKRDGYRLTADLPAAEFLRRHGQPTALCARLWEPLCVAALNTPLGIASAQVFANVLRDSLGGGRAASDLLFNRGDIGRLLPEAACAHIRSSGGEIRLASTVTGLARADDGFRLLGPDTGADRVIVATHPARVPALVARLAGGGEVATALRAFTWQPIVTLWLRFRDPPRFPFPMLALGHGTAPWAFERNDLAPGVVAIVASAEGPHLALAEAELCDAWLPSLAAVLGPLPPLLAWKRIAEKRATFACTPGLARPGNTTAVPGLYLAGDYTAGDYPATLEGAVRSGVECARTLRQQLRSGLGGQDEGMPRPGHGAAAAHDPHIK